MTNSAIHAGLSRRRVLAAGAAWAGSLAACSPKQSGARNVDDAIAWAKASLPASTPDIIQAAAKEGHLTLTMLNMGGAPEVVTNMVKGFNARYPFIAVEATTQSTLQLITKFNAELNAKTGVTDYINFPSNLKTTAELEKQGAIMPFVISEDAAFPAPAKRKGLWYAWRTEYPTTVYRKGAIKPDELKLVQTYEGLGDPRFKNRLAVASISNSAVAIGCYTLIGSAPKLWEGLAANKPHVKASGPAMLDGLLSGEYDVALLGGMMPNMVAAQHGAPIEFGVSAPYAPVYTPGGISALAPHPNAAKLFQDWVMSKEGQETWVKVSGVGSVRPDIAEKPWVEQQPWYFQDKARQIPIDWDDFAKKQPEVIARFKSDIQGG